MKLEASSESPSPPRNWLSSFELAPASGSSVAALDGLRAFAVIAIFLRHSWGLAGSPSLLVPLSKVGLRDVSLDSIMVMSSNGVDLFFVLSGYLLSRSFIASAARGAPRPDLRKYFKARLFRIAPAYWFALATLVLIFIPALNQSPTTFSGRGALSAISHAFGLQTVLPFSYGIWGAGSPYWTLTIEILFYAALPWVVRPFLSRRWWLAGIAATIVTFAWLTGARWGFPGMMKGLADHSLRDGASTEFVRFWLSKQLPGYALSFAIGIMVARIAYDRQRKLSREMKLVPPALFVAGVAIIVASMHLLGRATLDHKYYDGLVLMSDRSTSAVSFYFLEGPTMAIGFGLILLGIVWASDAGWTAIFRLKVLRLVGILGFSIYLWHMPFLYLYNHLEQLNGLSAGTRWARLMLITTLSLAFVSLFSFFCIEKPMIKRGRAKT
jgi:peptidoglycan/LPS O-acetylase OafA/YrhL